MSAMKRHHDADPELPLRSKRINTGNLSDVSADETESSDQPQIGFFDIAQELRDNIYVMLQQDIPLAHRGRRNEEDLATNYWEIGYIKGPSLSALVQGPDVSEEYICQLAKSMYVVATVSMQEDGILDEAPWYDSLPGWVREVVRGVRIVLCLGHEERDMEQLSAEGPQRFDVKDMYQCVQTTVNAAAASLPSLVSLEVMIPYACYFPHSTLINDIEKLGLDVNKLLGIRPTTANIKHCSIGFLIDVRLRTIPQEEYSLYGERMYDLLTEWGFMDSLSESPDGSGDIYKDDPYEDDQAGRWYATLSNRAPPYTHLGMEWCFVAPLPWEERASECDFTELPTSEDGLSDISIITDASSNDSQLDEEEHEVATAHIDQVFRNQEPHLYRVVQPSGKTIGYTPYSSLWVDCVNVVMRDYEPSVSDWRAACEAGVDMERAMRVSIECGSDTTTLQEFKEAMG